jgi:hypothetical protein
VNWKECTRHAAVRSEGEQRVLVVAGWWCGAWRPFAVDCSPANRERRPTSAPTSTASGWPDLMQREEE